MTPFDTINSFFQAIIDKKVAAICAFYVPDEHTYVILEGPRLSTLGYEAIAKGWKDFCVSTIHLKTIHWVEGPFEEAVSQMAWVSGIVHLTISIQGKTFEQTFRTSFVLKKSDNTEGGWLIRHEHVSGALADPYGIGDWLKPNDDK